MTFVSRGTCCIIALTILAVGCSSSSTSPTSSAPYSQTDLVVGTGATAVAGNRVTVAYTGWLYDSTQPSGKGKQFDSNQSFPLTLGAGGVIKGFEQGIIGMKVGGQRRVIIPPELGYGSAGSGNGAIPGNATIMFDITLGSVS